MYIRTCIYITDVYIICIYTSVYIYIYKYSYTPFTYVYK